MHTKSAKKRHRQSLERRDKNRAVRSSLKTQIKKVREAVKAGDLAKADAESRLAAKKLDIAASKGVIHKNSASRTKSRVSQFVKNAKQKATASA
jgi:small subunit ribosomal protein S20